MIAKICFHAKKFMYSEIKRYEIQNRDRRGAVGQLLTVIATAIGSVPARGS